MLISGVVFTHHLPEEVLPWITEARSVFDEVVIFIEEKRFTPGTVARAQEVGTRVVRYKADKWYDADCRSLTAGCKSDWVFALDYDEQLSPEWQQPEWRQLLHASEFTHFWCPRRQILPGRRYISSGPWWPDFQLRLLRNHLNGTAFPRKLHDTIYVPGPGAHFRHLAIHHQVFCLFSRSEREKKARFYDDLLPGAGLGHQYLYEDFSPPTASLPEPASLDIANELGFMKKLLPDSISKISLQIERVPRRTRATAWFWIEATIDNRTDVPLGSFPPFPVTLAYHWVNKSTQQTVVFDGIRTELMPRVEPHATCTFPMRVVAADTPGQYILQATMVQEHVRWFEEVRPEIVLEFPVQVC